MSQHPIVDRCPCHPNVHSIFILRFIFKALSAHYPMTNLYNLYIELRLSIKNMKETVNYVGKPSFWHRIIKWTTRLRENLGKWFVQKIEMFLRWFLFIFLLILHFISVSWQMFKASISLFDWNRNFYFWLLLGTSSFLSIITSI